MNICGIACCNKFQIIPVITFLLALKIFRWNLRIIRRKTKNVTQKNSSTDGHTPFMTLLFILFCFEKHVPESCSFLMEVFLLLLPSKCFCCLQQEP